MSLPTQPLTVSYSLLQSLTDVDTTKVAQSLQWCCWWYYYTINLQVAVLNTNVRLSLAQQVTEDKDETRIDALEHRVLDAGT